MHVLYEVKMSRVLSIFCCNILCNFKWGLNLEPDVKDIAIVYCTPIEGEQITGFIKCCNITMGLLALFAAHLDNGRIMVSLGTQQFQCGKTLHGVVITIFFPEYTRERHCVLFVHTIAVDIKVQNGIAHHKFVCCEGNLLFVLCNIHRHKDEIGTIVTVQLVMYSL